MRVAIAVFLTDSQQSIHGVYLTATTRERIIKQHYLNI